MPLVLSCLDTTASFADVMSSASNRRRPAGRSGSRILRILARSTVRRPTRCEEVSHVVVRLMAEAVEFG